MVVLSQPPLDQFSLIKTSKPSTTRLFTQIPSIDLSYPNSQSLLIQACQEFGFFKIINHGIPLDFITQLQDETINFFNLPLSDKLKAGPPDPYGYGSKRIGPNGDVGWIEYLLFNTNPQITSHKSLSIFQKSPEIFRSAVNEYVKAVKKLASEVLELIASGLKLEPKNVLSKMINDEGSDSCFRVNHYPPCPDLEAFDGLNLVGFGEHTDPQLISVLRSNNTSGLQICLRDGSWVSVPSDQDSFFFNVGDALQVMTNGRFMSVKHRVMTDNMKSRISMIYFGGPALNEKIAPLESLLEEGEERLYKEFTWFEYKKSAYKSRLADYRLGLFEKK